MTALFAKKPKIPALPPPPNAPTEADASVINAGAPDNTAGFASLINTSTTGLKRKAKTVKRRQLG